MKFLLILLPFLVFFVSCDSPFSSSGTAIPILTNHYISPVSNDTYEVTITNMSSDELHLWFESPAKGVQNFVLLPSVAHVFGSEYQLKKNMSYSVGGDGYTTKTDFIN